MLILLPSILLVATSMVLLVLRGLRPAFRFAWLIAVGGALTALLASVLWQWAMPISLSLPSWQPAVLFTTSPIFLGDRIAWPFVIGLTGLLLASLMTAGAQEDFPNSLMWAALLALTAFGLLALIAANPLTLVLVWTALDLLELITQLSSVKGNGAGERAVIAFSMRVLGGGMLVWAHMVSLSNGIRMDFSNTAPQAGLYLILAAGLRLSGLPLHLPYQAESVLSRGFGNTLLLVSAASSLILLTRVSPGGVTPFPSAILLILAAAAALYAGWLWLRAPDALTGRPFWLIGMAALAVSTTLRSNTLGVVAWGCVMILAGSVLFLSTIQNKWLNRVLLIGAWGLTALPFSMTALSWVSTAWFQVTLPVLIAAQSLFIAGYVRHALHPGERAFSEAQPAWTQRLYPIGIGFLLILQLVLGLWGWDGAFQIGLWPAGMAACILALIVVWAVPRFRIFNPIQAHWIRQAGSLFNGLSNNMRSLHGLLGQVNHYITDIFEGDGGVMWTLLFLVLFISLMAQAAP